MHAHGKTIANSSFVLIALAFFNTQIMPVEGQTIQEMPPVSPQPPAAAPIQGQPVAPQYSPAQLQQTAAPFNFRQYNIERPQPANGQILPGQTAAPFYPPLQNVPAAQFNMPAPSAPVVPISPAVSAIPAVPGGPALSADPYIRGKELIKQATALIAAGQLDQAVEPLQKSMEFRRVDPTPQFLLGLIYDSKGNLQEALNNYTQSIKKATSLGMDSSQLRINLANTLLKLNYVKEAEFDYKRAIEIDDKNDVAHLNYGRLLLFKGDNQAAFRELQRAHELMVTDPNLPLYEALALKGLGNVEESRLQLQVFLDRAKGINCDPRVINMAENLLSQMK